MNPLLNVNSVNLISVNEKTNEEITFSSAGITNLEFEKMLGNNIGLTEIEITTNGTNLDDELTKGSEFIIEVDVDGLDIDSFQRLRVSDYSVSYANEPTTRRTYSITFEDYVFSILRDRNVTISFTETNIQEAVNQIIDQKGVDISVDFRPTVDTSITQVFSFESLLSVIGDILPDRLLLKSDNKTLVINELPNSTTQFNISEVRNIEKNIIGQPISDIRVEGGQINTEIDNAEQNEIETQQSLIDSSGNQKTFSVPLNIGTNASVSSVNLQTRGDRDNFAGTLSVRLHSDVNGEPKEPEDPQKSIVERSLDANFVGEDGTKVNFGDNTIKTNVVHLVVSQNGSNLTKSEAFRIAGIFDPNGDFLPSVVNVQRSLPIALRVSDEDTREKYGIREKKIKRESLNSLEDARDLGQRRLSELSEPRKEISFLAGSEKIHNLNVLDIIEPNVPSGRTVKGFKRSQYIVRDISYNISGTKLETEITVILPSGF